MALSKLKERNSQQLLYYCHVGVSQEKITHMVGVSSSKKRRGKTTQTVVVCQGKTTQTDKSQKSEGKRESRHSGLPILIFTIIYYFAFFFYLYYTITCNPIHIHKYI